MYYKKVGESKNSYARYVFLNELLSGQDKEYISDLIIREGEAPLQFDAERCYILLLGLPKRVYTGYYNLDTNAYMEIYVRFEHKLRAYLVNNGYSGEVFLHLYGDKQICAVFSPIDRRGIAQPGQVASYAQDCLQIIYQHHFLKGCMHCNQTFFIERSIPLRDLSNTFKELLRLSDLSYFYKQPIVFTDTLLKEKSAIPNKADLQELRQEAANAVNAADEKLFLDTFQTLWGLVKYSFSRYLLEETALFFKQFYIQCCIAYDISIVNNVDVFFDGAGYPKIEDLTESLSGLFRECIAAIGQREQKYSRMVQKALRILKTGYHKPNISLTYVADQISVSPAYLSSIFNREIKMNMSRYIMKLRLEKALVLIKETDMKVTAVAQAVGYTNKRYFTETFKREIGCTPTEYRQSFH